MHTPFAIQCILNALDKRIGEVARFALPASMDDDDNGEAGEGRHRLAKPLCLPLALKAQGLGKVIVTFCLQVTGHGRITFVTKRLAFQLVCSSGFIVTQKLHTATRAERLGWRKKTCQLPSRFSDFFCFIFQHKTIMGTKRPLWAKARPVLQQLPLVAKPWI